MNLWQTAKFEKATIVEYLPDTDAKLVQRLKDLGFLVGEEVCCVRRLPFSGPTIYQVQDSIYALEKELAECVQVKCG